MVNTHLYWDPSYEDVKLWQTLNLVKEIERLAHTKPAAAAAAAGSVCVASRIGANVFSYLIAEQRHRHHYVW